ncbi:hypothetical protein ACX93W_21265 [Paenibacillus sp. CAU 1782]
MNTGKRFPFFFILANFIGTTGGKAVAGCRNFVAISKTFFIPHQTKLQPHSFFACKKAPYRIDRIIQAKRELLTTMIANAALPAVRPFAS